MPEYSNQTFSSDKCIHFDADYHTCARLVALVVGQPVIETWEHAQQMIDLARRFETFLVPSLMAQYLQRNPAICPDPWTLFTFASEFDFGFLAKIAITRFDSGTNIYGKKAWEVKLDTLEGLPPRYAMALLQGMAEHAMTPHSRIRGAATPAD
jgi:hypothetical protein